MGLAEMNEKNFISSLLDKLRSEKPEHENIIVT